MDRGTAKTLLFGSKLKIVAVSLVSLVATVGIAAGLGLIGVPGVADIDNEFGDVTESTTVIETDLIIHNPNPVGISLGDAQVEYTVSMNDVDLATGEREGISVGSGNTTVDLTTRMDNDQIPEWWATHIAADERSHLVVDAEVTHERFSRTASFDHDRTVETDLIGEFDSEEPEPVQPDEDSPLSIISEVSDPLLYINESNGEWGEVSADETPMEVDFVAYNPQPAPLTITQLEYEITMNDVQVGEGSTEHEYVIQPDDEETIETDTVIENERLDEWWVTHLQNEQTTLLEIQFWITFDVAGESIRVPVDALDHEETIETDIFEEEE